MARATEGTIVVEGYRDFVRDLGKLDRDLRKDTVRELRELAKPIAAQARANAPVRSGRLAASIKPSVTARGALIRSRLPQSPVIEFGGVIRPKGTPIVFKPREMVQRAVFGNADRVEREVAEVFDRAARRAGFK